MQKLIECVPNFSEGRDLGIIKQITDEIEKIDGVKLLDVDPGATTNRTVVTFVGTPGEVVEAAFQAAKKAQHLIDMRRHKGDHPRFGATDVCPLIPISGVTMEETAEHARTLGKRIGDELGIPVYLYEHAASLDIRRNLANCREGEYESLKDRICSADWKPDFGPTDFSDHVARSGATAVGARDFLIAVNFNLNTTSTRRANAIAFDVREKGRPKREGNAITGKPVLDENGQPVKSGEVGELVIKQPWIGMARGFWKERDRYLETYWSRFKNIWVHGDWAMRDSDGHYFILGRSDDTLKVAGKRVGPAEVESLLVAHPQVTEAAVIGVPDEVKGTAMVAFCVLGSSPPYEGGVDAASADGVVLSLETELKALVSKDMGKPLAPSKIHFVSALPKTRNAKVMRRVIRSGYLGEDPGDLSALENPGAVEEIQALIQH